MKKETQHTVPTIINESFLILKKEYKAPSLVEHGTITTLVNNGFGIGTDANSDNGS